MLIISTPSHIRPKYTSIAGSVYQLAAGHWIPAKKPMVLVGPQPDANSVSTDRHRNAYVDSSVAQEYRVPIDIAWGAFPFYISSSTLPSWLSISSDPASADYMVIKGTPPLGDAQSYSIAFTVSDQDGNTLNFSYTLVTSSTCAVFFSTTGSNSNTGTRTSPFADTTKVFVDNTGGVPSAYYGKMLIFLDGTHVIDGGAANNNNLTMRNGINPYVFMGLNGKSTTTLDFNASRFIVNNDQKGFWVSGLTFTNNGFNTALYTGGTSGGANANYIYVSSGAGDRVTIFENELGNIVAGSITDSNQAAVAAVDGGTLRQYWSLRNNTYNNYQVPLLDWYVVSKYTVQGNVFGTQTAKPTEGSMYLKGGLQEGSVRMNYSIGGGSFGPAFISVVGQNQTGTGAPFGDIEVCYNAYLNTTDNDGSVVFNSCSITTNPHYNLYLYRNTFNRWYGNYDGVMDVYEEGNIVIDDANYLPTFNVNTTYRTIHETNNRYKVTADNIIDSSANMTAAWSLANPGDVGTVGWGIS